MTGEDLLARVFSFFFKYRPAVFEKGHLAFESSAVAWVTALLLLMLAGGGIWAGSRGRTIPRRRRILVGLRVFVLALLALALLRPVMRASTALPGENFLAVLIDDSSSMRLPDSEGSETTRGAAARDTMLGETSELRRLLEQRFTLRYFRFASTAVRLDPAVPLGFEGRATHLTTALDQARRDLAGVPLAGAVVLSDGADNASGTEEDELSLDDVLLQYKSRAVPIYTIGFGEERFRRDLELTVLDGPRRVLAGSAFTIEVGLRQQGFDGESVRLTVERRTAGTSGSTLVARRDVDLERGSATRSLRMTLEAEATGPHVFRVTVEAAIGDGPAEAVTQNNARELLVTAEKRREKILYVEGEPRWEVKFLRQAVAGDDALQLVVLQRAADNRFLRLGVDDPLELVAGFPSTREELFAYRGVILGSVGADFFTEHQHRILEEFVSERGGGLLFLGGRRNFSHGGWADSELAGVFPVVLDGASTTDEPSQAFAVGVRATAAGLEHPALRLAETAAASAERWSSLPKLTVRQRLTRLKPGAVELLDGTTEDGGEVVILASQRYGAGRAVAFTVQDSWLWQMHADIPVDDQVHERLWRQLLRFLTVAVPRRVELEPVPNRVAPGEPLELVATVRDGAFLGLNDARVTAMVIDPLGGEHLVPLEWTVEKDGEYRASFLPEHEGFYEARMMAEADGEKFGGQGVGVDEGAFLAADLGREFFGAEMSSDLLGRIAHETGGRFYTSRTASGLAADARFTRSGRTATVSYELWDMPVVLLLILTGLVIEWLLRRRWGLA